MNQLRQSKGHTPTSSHCKWQIIPHSYLFVKPHEPEYTQVTSDQDLYEVLN